MLKDLGHLSLSDGRRMFRRFFPPAWDALRGGCSARPGPSHLPAATSPLDKAQTTQRTCVADVTSAHLTLTVQTASGRHKNPTDPAEQATSLEGPGQGGPGSAASTCMKALPWEGCPKGDAPSRPRGSRQLNLLWPGSLADESTSWEREQLGTPQTKMARADWARQRPEKRDQKGNHRLLTIKPNAYHGL